RRHLTGTICLLRESWGAAAGREPSPFWLDIPDELVETVDRRGIFDRKALRRTRLATEDAARARADDVPYDVPREEPPELPDRVSESPATESSPASGGDGLPAVGEDVSHPCFGRGR